MGYNEFFYKICISIVLVFSIIMISIIGFWEIFGGNVYSTAEILIFFALPYYVAIASMVIILIKTWTYKKDDD